MWRDGGGQEKRGRRERGGMYLFPNPAESVAENMMNFPSLFILSRLLFCISKKSFMILSASAVQ